MKMWLKSFFFITIRFVFSSPPFVHTISFILHGGKNNPRSSRRTYLLPRARRNRPTVRFQFVFNKYSDVKSGFFSYRVSLASGATRVGQFRRGKEKLLIPNTRRASEVRNTKSIFLFPSVSFEQFERGDTVIIRSRTFRIS